MRTPRNGALIVQTWKGRPIGKIEEHSVPDNGLSMERTCQHTTKDRGNNHIRITRYNHSGMGWSRRAWLRMKTLHHCGDGGGSGFVEGRKENH